VVDRDGIDGLAVRLGYSRRQLQRQLTATLGAGPLAIARAQRAQAARVLLEITNLPTSEVGFAAGFGSIRQFNDTIREVFAETPTSLRTSVRANPSAGAGTVTIRLSHRRPFWPESVFGHLVATAAPGVEEWRDGTYRRTLRLPFGHGIVALSPEADHISCRLTLTDMRDFSAAVARCRRLLDLDADPVAVQDVLGRDDALAEATTAAPGRRVPRTVDEHELAIRAVLGQQISVSAVRAHTARLICAAGTPIDDRQGGLTHLFPTADAVASLDPAALAMPRTRARTLVTLAEHLAIGKIDLGVGCDRGEAVAKLDALRGVGAWTIGTIAMRALGDPDAFLPDDLGVRAGASRLGLPSGAALVERSRLWRPWRAYAVQYLWGASDHPINQMPVEAP
jgi:AraC family transcriptional regulator of adaptative response / DNA-3-methyladenine glycosylase II